MLLYWQRRVERHSPPLPRSSSLFNCDYCSYFATGHALIRKTSPAAGGIMKQRQTAGHWTEKQRNRGRMECTLAIKMRIEVLKRKPNPTRLLDYLTFLTLTLDSTDDLEIKFFPFTTKPRDAAQKSQKLVNLEMWNLNHTGWGGSRLRSQRSNSSYKEFPSIALLPRSPWTFRQRYREFPHIV